MGKVCIGCGEEPDGVYHGTRYIVCGECHAAGADTYKAGGRWMFLRPDGDAEPAAQRYRDLQRLVAPDNLRKEATT